MKDGKIPNPNTINPIAGYDKEIYIKPTIKNKNVNERIYRQRV
jgi:virginiamycin A acetyltransferase